MPALEESSRRGRSQCLPAIAPWTLLSPSVGTLPAFSTTHRSAGVGLWLLLVFFLPKHSLGSSLDPFQDFWAERTIAWGLGPSRMVEP